MHQSWEMEVDMAEQSGLQGMVQKVNRATQLVYLGLAGKCVRGEQLVQGQVHDHCGLLPARLGCSLGACDGPGAGDSCKG